MDDDDHKIGLARRRVVYARNAYIINNSIVQQKLDSIKTQVKMVDMTIINPVSLKDLILAYENAHKSGEELSDATKKCIQLQHDKIMNTKNFNFIPK